ncbi:uncharacterized protein TNCV_450611 [Trichonephila clavipes]|nr:uncharacterized protein TNCV_450611 [Trichonephila clavipes]
MRVWKQWNDEHRTARKTGCARWKVMSAHADRHLLHMAVSDRTASSRQLAARWSTSTCVLMSASQFIDVYCTVDCVQGYLYTGSSSRQTIDGCVCNGPMNIELG